jgi:23S rRNA (cytidine1920-2'-O)/16S rRNA (cytidine1409-2'-O)-methyltransferase
MGAPSRVTCDDEVVASRRRAPFVALTELIERYRPGTPPDAIADGRVLVDGRVIDNPAARVRGDASVRVLSERRLRGDVKLSFAFEALAVDVSGAVAVDVGASTGGFTTALLSHGAERVYAVDAGVGQLRGSLHNDPRVINLERHNLADLTQDVVPDAVDVVTVDLSYLSIADALPQLATLRFSDAAELVALVKPTFELHRPTVASSDDDIADAVRIVTDALPLNGWAFVAECPAPATGQHGSREAFLHARR